MTVFQGQFSHHINKFYHRKGGGASSMFYSNLLPDRRRISEVRQQLQNSVCIKTQADYQQSAGASKIVEKFVFGE